MKFTTLFGGLVLSSLEVYTANANPMPGNDLVQHCCVELGFSDHWESHYVLWKAKRVSIWGGGGCEAFAVQSFRKPSQGGCDDWTFDTNGCGRVETAYFKGAQTRPAIYCEKPSLKYQKRPYTGPQ
ncbi:hypothetical protein E4U53_003233 [Claviceps sorghi]|nr:hypothetical protein E4U53_003233 [Claviceps sorghi]